MIGENAIIFETVLNGMVEMSITKDNSEKKPARCC